MPSASRLSSGSRSSSGARLAIGTGTAAGVAGTGRCLLHHYGGRSQRSTGAIISSVRLAAQEQNAGVEVTASQASEGGAQGCAAVLHEALHAGDLAALARFHRPLAQRGRGHRPHTPEGAAQRHGEGEQQSVYDGRGCEHHGPAHPGQRQQQPLPDACLKPAGQ